MNTMEDQLSTILNDPAMMGKIMAMANALQTPPPEEKPSKQEMPSLDMAMLQKFSGIAQHSNIDQREQALLNALSAYLQRDRIAKLEKAMRAVKLAKLASGMLGQGGLQSLSGR